MTERAILLEERTFALTGIWYLRFGEFLYTPSFMKTFIYEGVANWQQADAVVTIKYLGAEDIIVKMDTFNSSQKMCGLALFQNVNNETFSVEKIVQFYPGRQALDQAYGWNMRWTPGRKD